MTAKKLPPGFVANTERVKARKKAKVNGGDDMAGSGKMSKGAPGAAKAIQKNKSASKQKRGAKIGKSTATTEGAQNARIGSGTPAMTSSSPARVTGAVPRRIDTP